MTTETISLTRHEHVNTIALWQRYLIGDGAAGQALLERIMPQGLEHQIDGDEQQSMLFLHHYQAVFADGAPTEGEPELALLID